MDVAVGDGLLGRVIDPLGRPLDGNGPVAASERLPIERPAAADHGPRAGHRAAPDRPQGHRCAHSHRARPARADSGRPADGQDAPSRSTPSSTSAARMSSASIAPSASALPPWRRPSPVCGKRARWITPSSSWPRATTRPGLAYIAPYAATSIAEHFMEAGRDVLIVYDDLTQHARAYRELSLLLRRPPGREAFPGDIFYIHSRLLERATHLRKELGGGSLTALPIIETEAQDISAYIPTNLISITDGQIYLSPSLFELGVLPAVDVGKSVSRVGGKAQRAAYRAVAGDLKLAYAQFEELETFARFGARLDEDTRKIIEHGRRIRACLKQPEFAPVSVPAQIAVLLALTAELFDPVPLDQMTDAGARRARGGGEYPGGGVRAIRNRRQIERRGSRKRSSKSPAKRSPVSNPSRRPMRSEGPKPSSRARPAKRSHERHHGEPAPKDQQRRRSPIRRPHDESPGRLEYRTIREIGARAWPTTIAPWSWGWARAFGKADRLRRWPTAKERTDAECDRRRRVRLRSGTGGPVQRCGGRLCDQDPRSPARQTARLGRRRARSCAPGGRGPAADWDFSPCRIPSRPSRRSSGRFRSKAKRTGPRASIRDVLCLPQPPAIRRPLRAGQPAAVAARCAMAAGSGQNPLADRKPCPRSWAAASTTLRALIREYLFISLFRACAESLASENASRLAAMQRADKNIDDLLEMLHGTFHRLRQSGIDEELVRRDLRLRGAVEGNGASEFREPEVVSLRGYGYQAVCSG